MPNIRGSKVAHLLGHSRSGTGAPHACAATRNSRSRPALPSASPAVLPSPRVGRSVLQNGWLRHVQAVIGMKRALRQAFQANVTCMPHPLLMSGLKNPTNSWPG